MAEYKQVIIVRKDLNMTPDKLIKQVANAAIVFLTKVIQKNTKKIFENQYPVWEYIWNNDSKDIIKRPQKYLRSDFHTWAKEARDRGEDYFYARPIDPNNKYGKFELCEPIFHYEVNFKMDKNLYEQWTDGLFTKIICGAKNKNQLLEVIDIAESLGLEENKDFFLIRDDCQTELISEDEDGKTLTCIGFKPLPIEISTQLSKKYQLL